MTSVSVPTTSALPNTHRVPANNPSVFKLLQRLSRPSLLSLVLDWLEDGNQPVCAPYLLLEADDVDDQDLYPASSSLEELREVYTSMQERKGSKRDVVDRILEGDWRNGITLYQLATVDSQYLYDHPSSQKWSALKVIRLSNHEEEDGSRAEKKSMTLPRFHPPTFLQNLKKETLPDVKAHYTLEAHKTLPLYILRIFIVDSPYNTERALHTLSSNTLLDSSKTFYVAFPHNSPYIYVSLTTSIGPSSSSDSKSLRKLALDSIPKAMSRPRERYGLESTNLSAKTLEALVERRGGGRTNAAAGGWSIYAEKDQADHPLNNQLPPLPSASAEEEEDTAETSPRPLGMKRKVEEDPRLVKRRKLVAQARFGNSAKLGDGKGIERFDIRIEDPYLSASASDAPVPVPLEDHAPQPAKSKGRRSSISEALDQDASAIDDNGVWIPDVRITFHGSHVFAGIREWVEEGIIDGEKLPGWMTGEEGVSVGVVKDGRIRGHKGGGV